MKTSISCLRLSLFISVALFLSANSFGAEIYNDEMIPVIGKPCPNYFLTGIRNFSTTQRSVRQMKGKPFILDFFSMGCTSCYESFPKINKFKEIYGSSLNFLLVGQESAGIREQFAKFEKRDNLNLPVCYSKSLFDKMAIHVVPYVVWVGADGIVKAVTASEDINVENLSKFIAGHSFAFSDFSHAAEEKRDLSYDAAKPLLMGNNGGPDSSFYFRSVLSPGSKQIPQQIPIFINNTMYSKYGYMHKNRYQATNIWAEMLYQVAYGDTLWQYPSLDLPNYYGTYARQTELHLKDSSLFRSKDSSGTFKSFCYSLSVPNWKSGTLDMQHIMQRDLENYFGYKVHVELKDEPCWVLSATDDVKLLKTKGGEAKYFTDERTKTDFVNAPIKALIMQIAIYHPDDGPFLDETGIMFPIDLLINFYPSESLDQWTEHLKPFGLILQKTTRKLKVIVISDPVD